MGDIVQVIGSFSGPSGRNLEGTLDILRKECIRHFCTILDDHSEVEVFYGPYDFINMKEIRDFVRNYPSYRDQANRVAESEVSAH
ncbi:MAG: hypothetical protein AABW88_04530 [Nanoarchaeota archaeon]